MEQFNSTIQLQLRLSADDSQSGDILNALVADHADADRFTPHTPTGVRFWRNIHNLLQSLHPTQKLLWSSLAAVQEAAQQPQCRRFLTLHMDYVPAVAELLLRCPKSADTVQQLQILQTLDTLSCDYRSAADQPLFAALVRHLLKLLFAHRQQRPLAAAALSCLLQLCCRNPAVFLQLRHEVQLSELNTALEEFRVLGGRMQFLLMRNTTDASHSQIDAYLPNLLAMIRKQLAVLAEPSDAAAEVNATMRHLGALVDEVRVHRQQTVAEASGSNGSGSDGQLQPPLDMAEEFGVFLGHVQRTAAAVVAGSAEPGGQLLDAQLRLCIAIIRLSADSLRPHLNQLTNIVMSVLDGGPQLHSPSLAATAFDALRTIVDCAASVASVFCDKMLALLRSQLGELGAQSLRADCGRVEALCRLCDTCLDKVPATALDLVRADTFVAMWQPMSAAGGANPFQLSSEKVGAMLRTLDLLRRCAEMEAGNSERTEVLGELMSRRAVHWVLALGSQQAEADTQRLVFRLARSLHFPADSVATIVNTLRQRAPLTSLACQPLSDSNDSLPSPRSTLSSAPNCCTLAAPQRAQLQQLMTSVSATLEQRGASHLSTTHIIDLYRHKLRDTEQREQQLQQSHERTLRTVSQLQHALTQQTRELSAYDATVYAAVAGEEVLRGELELMRRDNRQLKQASHQLNERLDRVTRRGELDRREAGQRLKIAEVEIQNFKKQIETERQKAEADEKRRLRDFKEHQKQTDSLKQSIAKYEARVAENEDRLLQATNELAAEKVRSRSAVAVKEATLKQLEAQLAEKQKELARVVAANEEDIKLRNSIMQMIQGKTNSGV